MTRLDSDTGPSFGTADGCRLAGAGFLWLPDNSHELWPRAGVYALQLLLGEWRTRSRNL